MSQLQCHINVTVVNAQNAFRTHLTVTLQSPASSPCVCLLAVVVLCEAVVDAVANVFCGHQQMVNYSRYTMVIVATIGGSHKFAGADVNRTGDLGDKALILASFPWA